MTSAQSTQLVFTVVESDLVVNVVAGGKQDVLYEGATIKLLPSGQLRVSMVNKRPIEILSELRDMFSALFLFGGSERFDTVVQDIAQNFQTGNVRDTALRKGYAKYFYEMFIYRNSKALVRDGGFKETALIVTELLSWYFIRRAVHIYVVCTILDKVKGLSSASGASGASGASAASTLPPTIVMPNTIDQEAQKKAEEFRAQAQALQQQLSNVQQQLLASNASKPQITAELNNLQNTIAGMTQTLANTQAELQACQQRNQVLATELANFKELLLSSTSMIFKMDEIPNLPAAP
jgi:hypothetical protein